MSGITRITLAAIRKHNSEVLKQKQVINEELKLQKICQKVVQSCSIPKPVNYSVNSGREMTFKDLDFQCGNSIWAPWSFENRFSKKHFIK